MEEVNIAEINLGNTPPLVHKIYPPSLDERGIWIDADVTYEGLVSASISTKLNLMRLKKQETGVPIANNTSNGKCFKSSVLFKDFHPFSQTIFLASIQKVPPKQSTTATPKARANPVQRAKTKRPPSPNPP